MIKRGEVKAVGLVDRLDRRRTVFVKNIYAEDFYRKKLLDKLNFAAATSSPSRTTRNSSKGRAKDSGDRKAARKAGGSENSAEALETARNRMEISGPAAADGGG